MVAHLQAVPNNETYFPILGPIAKTLMRIKPFVPKNYRSEPCKKVDESFLFEWYRETTQRANQERVSSHVVNCKPIRREYLMLSE